MPAERLAGSATLTLANVYTRTIRRDRNFDVVVHYPFNGDENFYWVIPWAKPGVIESGLGVSCQKV
jgi:hypothetical protein